MAAKKWPETPAAELDALQEENGAFRRSQVCARMLRKRMLSVKSDYCAGVLEELATLIESGACDIPHDCI